MVEPWREVDAVGPEVDITLGREIAPLPMLQLALPDLLEAGNGRGREPRRFGPQERRKRLAEIARGDALQIKPGQEFPDRLGAPEIGRQDP